VVDDATGATADATGDATAEATGDATAEATGDATADATVDGIGVGVKDSEPPELGSIAREAPECAPTTTADTAAMAATAAAADTIVTVGRLRLSVAATEISSRRPPLIGVRSAMV
jgi:hypothetical protein